MKSITQDLKFKQAAITYSFKYGVTKAAIQYKKTRQWIYYWRKRYIPGDIHSLQEKSRKPHSHPNAHKNTEILLIENMRRCNPDEGLTMFWIKLQKRGYTRCITSLYRVMQKLGYYKHEKKSMCLKNMNRCNIRGNGSKWIANMFRLSVPKPWERELDCFSLPQ